MRKLILLLSFSIIFTAFMSCSSNKVQDDEILTEEETEEVENMLKSDQEKLDSMRKALEEKYKD